MKIHYLQSTLRYSDSQPLSFCTLTYVCVPLSSPFFCSDTQPHLHEIVNRSMSLANTAQEPCNYFLLLRALFRSIGGGQKRNTTISLRPRDHSLSYSHAGFLSYLQEVMSSSTKSSFPFSPTSCKVCRILPAIQLALRADFHPRILSKFLDLLVTPSLHSALLPPSLPPPFPPSLPPSLPPHPPSLPTLPPYPPSLPTLPPPISFSSSKA